MGKFLIGLIIGVGLAIGIVYYMNHSQTQLVPKFNNIEESVSSNPSLLSPGTKIKEVDNGSGESSYDFYQLLQDKNANSAAASQDNAQQTSARFLVEVGPFSDISAAQDIKGRLALLGYEAKISSNKNESGLIYKVVVGFYNSEDEANFIQHDLSDNEIKSIVTKLN